MTTSQNLSKLDSEPFDQPSLYQSKMGVLQYLTKD